MKKLSLFKLSGLPDAFGLTILMLFLILTLAPYFPGADFKIFTVPILSTQLTSMLKILGPIMMVLGIVSFVPIFTSKEYVALENPFGSREILLNGQELLITKKDLSDTKNRKALNFPKFLFQINNIQSDLDMKHEMISTLEYAALINSDTGWISLQNNVKGNPALRNGKVFRIYQEKSFDIKITRDSYEGIRVSDDKYQAAKKFMGQPFNNLSNAFKEDENDSKEEVNEEAISEFENMNIEDLQNKAKDILFEDIEKNTFTIFNELSIVIVDKNDFELQAIATNGGNEIQANPLYYLLSFGGILPYFNVQNIKDISISRDSKIWAFYAERKLNNVIVNGERQNEIHTDFYRIYAMNSDYIYQITLSYTPSIGTPRKTWDKLVELLKSLRIVST